MRLYSTADARFAFDQVLIDIPSKEDNDRIYLSWQPVKATARLKGAAGQKRKVTLRNAGRSGGGKVVFGEAAGTVRPSTYTAKLDLTLIGDAPTAVEFWIAGIEASSEDGDAAIEAVADNGAILAAIPMMVRIRKDAEKLNARERDRFLRALAWLNAAGAGYYTALWNMHVAGMEDEAHGFPGFLPWHRAYLIDLERRLQFFDPSVALPYWRFDTAAPKLFNANFLGESKLGMSANPTDESIYRVTFSVNNPLFNWFAYHPTIFRAPRLGWNNAADPPSDLIDEAATLALGTQYAPFRSKMEGNPHGRAHTRWWGDIDFVPTAPRDPLFFLLHCNVDRLWGLWQKAVPERSKLDDDAAYSPRDGTARIGHNPNNSMWPWNGVFGTGDPGDRPNFSPGDGLFPSGIAPVPPNPANGPLLKEMIDYQGRHGDHHLGYDYDDVRFLPV